MVVCFIGAALGIGVADLLEKWNGYEITSRPPLLWILLFLFSMGCILFFYRRFRKHTLYGSLWIVLLSASFFGFRYQYYTIFFPRSETGFRISTQSIPVFLDGWICDLPTAQIPGDPPLGRNIESDIWTQFTIKAKSVSNGRQWESCSGLVSVILSGKADTILEVGDLVRLKGYISCPPSTSNPCDIDKRYQMRTRRINARININRMENVQILTRNDRWRISRFFENLRRESQRTLEKNLSSRNAAIASAMILGLREDIDEDLQAQFRETGTAHILAISGMHLTIISGFFFYLLRFFSVPFRLRSIIIAMIVLFYFMLTDGRPPVLRASILIWTGCSAVFLKRSVLQLNNLVLAALCILIINPTELFQFGTHLSFMATATFLWLAQSSNKKLLPKEPLETDEDYNDLPDSEKEEDDDPSLANPPFRHPRHQMVLSFGKYFKDLFVTSGIVWIVLLPLIVRKLNLLTPIALALNPIIFIPMSIAYISGLLLVVFAWISPDLAVFFHYVPDFLFDIFLGILNTAHSLPYGYFWCIGIPVWFCWGIYLPLIAAFLFPDLREYGKIFLIFLLIWFGIGIAVHQIDRWNTMRKNELEITLFSIGHGSAALFNFPDGRTIVHDCGSFSSPHHAGTVLAKNIWNRGKNHIDLVILTHPDSDHYNAFDLLAKYFSIGGVVVPPIMFDKKNENVDALKRLIDAKGIPVYYRAKEDSLADLGFPEIRVLHPIAESVKKYRSVQSNANSLVALLEHEGRSLLFPGDLDTRNAVFLEELPLKLDLLIAPHHGGKSENYQRLLDWGRPHWILISGGMFQRNPESEHNLRKSGYVVYNTLENGAIQIRITKEKMKVDPWKRSDQ